jgi:hypothetical protein
MQHWCFCSPYLHVLTSSRTRFCLYVSVYDQVFTNCIVFISQVGFVLNRLFIYLIFCTAGDWTLGLTFARHLSHTASTFSVGYFWDRFLFYAQVGLDHDPICASLHSWDDRCAPCPAHWLNWGLMNFFAQAGKNCDPPDLYLLRGGGALLIYFFWSYSSISFDQCSKDFFIHTYICDLLFLWTWNI